MNIALEQTEVSGAGAIRPLRPLCAAARARVSPGMSCCAPCAAPHAAQSADQRPCLATRPQEYVNGQLKNKYGDAFIRGNNGEPSAPRACGARASWACPALCRPPVPAAPRTGADARPSVLA
jgi:hypothetical protein